MTISLRIPSLAAVIAAAGLLSACGGGGGSSVASPTVTGTAATGVAIASGTVTLKCVGGTSSVVTTNTDGSFTIDVGSLTFPCVGRVDYKESGTGTARKLHTLVEAAGTANITPVTELLLASLTGAAATKAFDNFDGTAVKGFTAAQIKAALDAVKVYLQAVLGVDVSNLGDDPIGTKFVAKTATGDGDKFDKVLDDLKAKLIVKGKKLDDAETDVGSSVKTGTAAGTLTVSAASNSARNGSYKPTGAKFASGSDTGFNGQTSDGKFEMEVVWTTSNTIKRAHIWFFDSGNVIKFFGCDGQTIVCTGVAYDPALDQLSFTNVALSQVADPFSPPSASDSRVSGGETLSIDGKLSVK